MDEATQYMRGMALLWIFSGLVAVDAVKIVIEPLPKGKTGTTFVTNIQKYIYTYINLYTYLVIKLCNSQIFDSENGNDMFFAKKKPFRPVAHS